MPWGATRTPMHERRAGVLEEKNGDSTSIDW